MEELIKKVELVLNQYAQECMGNRLNQFTFMSLKQTILGEITNYTKLTSADQLLKK